MGILNVGSARLGRDDRSDYGYDQSSARKLKSNDITTEVQTRMNMYGGGNARVRPEDIEKLETQC